MHISMQVGPIYRNNVVSACMVACVGIKYVSVCMRRCLQCDAKYVSLAAMSLNYSAPTNYNNK